MLRRTVLASLAGVPGVWGKPLDAGFRAQLMELMAVGPVPGMVIGVMDGKGAAEITALGHVTPGGAAVSGDTIFQAASLTKQVTAYVVLGLHARGLLDLDKPVVEYVDGLEDQRSRLATARHLLSHSGGFPNWRFEAGAKLEAQFEPGGQWQYSGEGYVYLQRIVEKLTGKPFGAAVAETVFGPLGMRSSSLRWRPDWAGRYAIPHRRRGEPVANWEAAGRAVHELAGRLGREPRYEESLAAADRPLPNWILPNAAASLLTTANDYVLFLRAAMREPLILKPQISMRSGKGWRLGWGLGWGTETAGGRDYLWQWGDNGGFKNIVFAEPGRGRAWFVFTNGDAGARIYDRVIVRLTGVEHPAVFWI